jgi:hypothetical protein
MAQELKHSSGATCREIATSYSAIIVRLVRNCALGRTIQYPETLVVQPISRGAPPSSSGEARQLNCFIERLP